MCNRNEIGKVPLFPFLQTPEFKSKVKYSREFIFSVLKIVLHSAAEEAVAVQQQPEDRSNSSEKWEAELQNVNLLVNTEQNLQTNFTPKKL